MKAYSELYLDCAQQSLGWMLDYVVHDLSIAADEYMGYFEASGNARCFEQGLCSIVAGKSGYELAFDTLESCGFQRAWPEPTYTLDRSPEFWAGWALAFYQWSTAQRFSHIIRVVSMEEIIAMYHPYHEMDISHFARDLHARLLERQQGSNLKRLRETAGLSQSALAKATGIPVRTIQQYEQRQKNINKAQAEYVIRFAQVLHCEPADLLERQNEERFEYELMTF